MSTAEATPIKPKKPIDYENNKYCGYRGVWEVYPDVNNGWDEKKWGPAPMLGYVRADDPYWALYAAYNKGIANAFNATFGYVIEKAKKFVANI